MKADEVLKSLESEGATVHFEGGEVRIRYPAGRRDRVAPLIARLRSHKAEVLAILTESLPTPCQPHSADQLRPFQRSESVQGQQKAEDELRYEIRWNDPLWRAAMGALERLRQIEWPIDLRLWLWVTDRHLHQKLYQDLPNQIDALWDAWASLSEFQSALDAWVATHEEAVELWKKRRAD